MQHKGLEPGSAAVKSRQLWGIPEPVTTAGKCPWLHSCGGTWPRTGVAASAERCAGLCVGGSAATAAGPAEGSAKLRL